MSGTKRRPGSAPPSRISKILFWVAVIPLGPLFWLWDKVGSAWTRLRSHPADAIPLGFGHILKFLATVWIVSIWVAAYGMVLFLFGFFWYGMAMWAWQRLTKPWVKPFNILDVFVIFFTLWTVGYIVFFIRRRMRAKDTAVTKPGEPLI